MVTLDIVAQQIVVDYAANEFALAQKLLLKKLRKTKRLLKLSANKQNLHIVLEHMYAIQKFIQALSDCHCEHCWNRGAMALEIVRSL